MLERLEERAIRWLRVPPAPTPPAGAPGSLQTFRAGRNYLLLKMVLWGGAQIGAAMGLIFSIYFIREVEIQIEMERAAILRDEQEALRPEAKPDESVKPAGKDVSERPEFSRGAVHQTLHDVTPPWLRRLPARVPEKAWHWIKFGEIVGILGYVIQFPWSLLAVRLDFMQRWYMVTDRSLRLRWGVVKIHESTMSFANLQQVLVKQGPLQRLLKLADVEVRSAGGGMSSDEHPAQESMHCSLFHAVDNAEAIRDLILVRLRHFRQAGLGEPDDHQNPRSGMDRRDSPDDSWAAAREVLAEVRALRDAVKN